MVYPESGPIDVVRADGTVWSKPAHPHGWTQVPGLTDGVAITSPPGAAPAAASREWHRDELG